MSLVLPVLSELPSDMPWSLGGGTALALQLNHRISFDVDIFFEHPRALTELMKNQRTRDLSDDREFPGNYLKIIRPEGEIDFILAANITEAFCTPYDFNGKQILLETPAEIICKKIRYRGSTFTYRDVYDLAAVVRNSPNLLERLSEIEIVQPGLERVLQRVQFFQENKGVLKAELVGADSTLKESMFDICIDALQDAIEGKASMDLL